MGTNIKNIENLLSQVHTISESYKRVAEATGDNFNIFSVLGIEHYEESTHSRFLAELLNPEGSHGFKNIFLVEFLNAMKIDVDYFDTTQYEVRTEYDIGNKTDSTGGRIDILLTDNKGSQIMIENKIYAQEQENQLFRYYNFNPTGKLFFLTLFGNESVQDIENDKYTAISYRDDIIKWLEVCQQKAVDNPVVRETIKQYKNLIKKLTNQNISSSMNSEILKTIVGQGKKENFESLINLVNLSNEIYKYACKECLFPTIDLLIEKHNLTTTLKRDVFINKSSEWLIFSLNNKQMEQNNLQICFHFNQKKGVNNLIIGFNYIDHTIKNNFDYSKLKDNFESHFIGKRQETEGWPAFQYYNKYRNWQDLKVLKEIIHGDFNEDFMTKIETLLDIAEKSF